MQSIERVNISCIVSRYRFSVASGDDIIVLARGSRVELILLVILKWNKINLITRDRSLA